MRHVSLLAGVIVLLLFAGCLNGQELSQKITGQKTAAVEIVPDATPTTTVNAEDAQFHGTATVSPGDAVRFVNQDSFDHTVTVKAENVSHRLSPGTSVTLQFNEPGSYRVICTIHPGMETTVTVTNTE